MQARMKNPAMVLGAMEPFQALFKAVYAGGVDPATLELVHLRASQINGCSAWNGSIAPRTIAGFFILACMIALLLGSFGYLHEQRLPGRAGPTSVPSTDRATAT